MRGKNTNPKSYRLTNYGRYPSMATMTRAIGGIPLRSPETRIHCRVRRLAIRAIYIFRGIVKVNKWNQNL